MRSWVEIVLAFREPRFGSPEDQAVGRALEDAVVAAVRTARAGNVDGNQIGEGEWRIFVYTADLASTVACLEEAIEASRATGYEVTVTTHQPAAMQSRVTRGSVYAIPIPSGFGYAQYVGAVRRWGRVLVVLRTASKTKLPATQLDVDNVLFGPVLAGFHSAVWEGQWTPVGRLPIRPYEIKFRWRPPRPLGKPWKIFDGAGFLAPASGEDVLELDELEIHTPGSIAEAIENAVRRGAMHGTFAKRRTACAAKVSVGDIVEQMVAVSGTAAPPGAVPVPENPVFDPSVPGISRPFDAEVKVLEAIAARIGSSPRVAGTVDLYPELPPCPTCLSVFAQFRQRYPNVALTIKSGGR